MYYERKKRKEKKRKRARRVRNLVPISENPVLKEATKFVFGPVFSELAAIRNALTSNGKKKKKIRR